MSDSAMMVDTVDRSSNLHRLHLLGPGPSDYITPTLKDKIAQMGPYFKLHHLFPTNSIAPSNLFAKEAKLHEFFDPVSQPTTTEVNTVVQFKLIVRPGCVVDMRNVYLDIIGRIDKGRSFKPYGGTAYNSLLPKNQLYNHTTGITANVAQADGHVNFASSFADANALTAQVNVGGDGGVAIHPHRKGQTADNHHSEARPDFGATRAISMQFGGNAARGGGSAYGALAVPRDAEGRTNAAPNPAYHLFATADDDDNIHFGVKAENTLVWYPDTRIMVDSNLSAKAGQHSRTSNPPCFVAFRDLYNGLVYYDGVTSQTQIQAVNGRANLIEHAYDRRTDMSYTHKVARRSHRALSIAYTQSCVDTYDPSVRFFSNLGYEDPPLRTQALVANAGETRLTLAQRTQNNNAAVANSGLVAYTGGIPAVDINLEATQQRNWLAANIWDYVPSDRRVEKLVSNARLGDHVVRPEDRLNEASRRLHAWPRPVAQTYENLGAKWSVDAMDTVNPFNHHRNQGLVNRSLMLGNARRHKFHIKVPFKHMAMQQAVLLPGEYMIQYDLRRDVNTVLQSSIGHDLRQDGAKLDYDRFRLYVSSFPFSPEAAALIITELRMHNNSQTFFDTHGQVHWFHRIPANADTAQVVINNMNLAMFRGWQFARVKANEVQANPSMVYDPNLTYSGTRADMDSTYYLNHTLRSVHVKMDSNSSWPGLTRLLMPEKIILKNTNGDETRTMNPDPDAFDQTAMHMDGWLTQQLAYNKIGFQGYGEIENSDHTYPYGFNANFVPMIRQRLRDNLQPRANYPATLAEMATHPFSSAVTVQNSGVSGGLSNAAEDQRHHYVEAGGYSFPANGPWPLIGEHAPTADQVVTEKKYLLDRCPIKIPFSTSFMTLGNVTELGYAHTAAASQHHVNIDVDVDPMPEDTFLHVMFGVFDVFQLQQVIKDRTGGEYFRMPFNKQARLQ